MATQRIGALAKLPLFYDLAGRRALVAGGSAAAAWKAELLAAAGAHVAVLATDLDVEMASLAEHGASAGTIELMQRKWGRRDLVGKAIAVCDARDAEDALAFRAACRTAGVPCNVIDQPEFCDFFFGSIVNRSPVVVGISTDGAAPILGQAIRARIEALLPRSLAGWTSVAKELRTGIAAGLESSASRRRFWEGFARLAFTQGHEDAASALRKLAFAVAREPRARGRLTKIEVCSDPDLLTLRTVRVLQSADIILFDDAVSPQILDWARREAKRVPINASPLEVNGLVVRHIRQGRHVAVLRCTESAGIPSEDAPDISMPRRGRRLLSAAPRTCLG